MMDVVERLYLVLFACLYCDLCLIPCQIMARVVCNQGVAFQRAETEQYC